MQNPFKAKSDATNIISRWLQLKMNNQFNTEIDLDKSYIIDIDGSGLVLPTDGESSLNDGQKSHLGTYCRMINNGGITLEKMDEEINGYIY